MPRDSGDAATFVDRITTHFRQWGFVMAVSGWLLGNSLWVLLHLDEQTHLLDNKFRVADRHQLLIYGAVGVVGVGILYGCVWLFQRRRAPETSPTQSFASFSKAWSLSFAVPLLVAMFTARIERARPLLTLFYISLLTALVMAWAHGQHDEGWATRLFSRKPQEETPQRKWRAVISMMVTYGVTMTLFSLVEHWSFATHAYDLGIYDNILWQSTNGNWMGCSLLRQGTHLSVHFDPLLVVVFPFYELFPRAETLLVFQSWWLASAGIPLFLIARRYAGGCVPRATVAIFFLNPALHGINLYDFHSLALSVPLLLWSVHWIDKGAKAGFVISFAMLLLVREDMAIIGGFIGLYAVLRRRPAWGLLTIVAAAAYFVVVKIWFMSGSDILEQSDPSTHSFIYYYSHIIPHPEEGMGGLVVSVFSNPGFLAHIFFLNDAKILYVLVLLGPLLFLPLIGGPKRVLMLYGLAFIGLASRRPVYSLHFQYSAVILPFLVASVPEALARIRRSPWMKRASLDPDRVVRILVIGMLTASALCSARFGALAPNKSFHGGFTLLNRHMSQAKIDRYRGVRRLIDQVPQAAVVAASSELVPHLSNRREIYQYPSKHRADYLLLNTRSLNKTPKHKSGLERVRGTYETVGAYQHYELFRRTAPN